MSLGSETTGLKPGTYRLTVDLPPLAKDGRRRNDWRYQPLKKGMLFTYTEHFDEFKPTGKHKAMTVVYRELQAVGKPYSIDPFNLKLFKSLDLVATLVPVPEEPSMYLRREHGCTPSTATRILDLLVESGKITFDDVQKLAARKDQ